jgi:hypothetical protein
LARIFSLARVFSPRIPAPDDRGEEANQNHLGPLSRNGAGAYEVRVAANEENLRRRVKAKRTYRPEKRFSKLKYTG